MVMRVDEARHHDPAARIDHRSAIRAQVRADGDDLRAFDQHVGLRKIADVRVHRHHGPAANEQSPTRPTAVARLVPAVSRCTTRREQAGSGSARRGCRLQEIAPRVVVVLWIAFITEFAHLSSSRTATR